MINHDTLRDAITKLDTEYTAKREVLTGLLNTTQKSKNNPKRGDKIAFAMGFMKTVKEPVSVERLVEEGHKAGIKIDANSLRSQLYKAKARGKLRMDSGGFRLASTVH